MAKIKTQITLDEALLKEVDEYCEKMYMTRSGLVSQALVQTLTQAKLTAALADMSASIRRIADMGTMDEQSKKDLEQFQTLCSMLIK